MPTQVLQTTGADETCAVLSEVYGGMSASFPSPDSGIRIERDVVGPVTLDRVAMDFDATFKVGPAPHITLIRMRSGTATFTSGEQESVVGPGDLFVPADPARPYRVADRALVEDVVSLPGALLQEVASSATGPDGPPVRLTGWRPASFEAAAHVNRTRDYVLRSVRAVDEAADPTLVHGSLVRLLAAAVLVAFPSTALLEPTFVDRRDAHPETVRRAVAFIEGNPDVDLSVVDVARAARVSVRALQLAFRRHLGTTPMRYLRQVRLDLARGDLVGAAPGDGVTVGQVATRWGYTDLSRFAVDYRDAFGETPVTALRR